MRSFGRLLIEGTAYSVTEVEKMGRYVTTHNNAAKREKWSRLVYEVTISENQIELMPECGQFEHRSCWMSPIRAHGMLCCHVLWVMDVLHLEEIPAKHIVKRWTKEARDILSKHLIQVSKEPFS